MALDADALSPEVLAFLGDRHLAALTLVRPDGRPHSSPVGFTYDPGARVARIITWSGSIKARLVERHGTVRATVCQVDGARWLTLEGAAVVTADPDRCADGVSRYAARYSPPKDRGAERRVIEVAVDRILGRA